MNVSSFGNFISLLGRISDTSVSTEPYTQTKEFKPVFARSADSKPIERDTPESTGVPSQTVLDFIRSMRDDKTLCMQNVMILRRGKIIFETAFDDGDIDVWKYTYSACKSIVSLAVGFAVDEGLLTVQTKISDIFAEEMPTAASQAVKELTVRDLLTMTSPVIFAEAESLVSDNWIKSYLSSAVKSSGEFNYNSLSTYMLSAAVCRLSGQSLTEYLTPRLFEPLGIKNIYWETGPDGFEKGGWGLFIRPEDMAKIGLTVLNGGICAGKRIISEEWIREATEMKVIAPESCGRFNYAYQMWCGRDSDTFLFNGMLGQNVLGFKDTDILIVTNASNTELFQQSNYYDLAIKYFSKNGEGGLSESPLPESPASYNELLSFARACRASEERGELPLLCEKLCGESYICDRKTGASVGILPMVLQISYNNYTKGLCRIEFYKKDGKFYLLYREADAVHRIPVGFGKPYILNMKFGGAVYRAASSGGVFENEDGVPVLKIRISFLETPCIRIIKLFFDSRGTYLVQTEVPGAELARENIYEMKKTLEETRLVRGAIKKIDDDYLFYRIDKVFSPRIPLKKENEEEKTADN